MDRDKDLRLAVIEELDCEPEDRAAEMIGVSVTDESVTLTGTLTGFVTSYPEKLAAAQGEKRFSVVAVADEDQSKDPRRQRS